MIPVRTLAMVVFPIYIPGHQSDKQTPAAAGGMVRHEDKKKTRNEVCHQQASKNERKKSGGTHTQQHNRQHRTSTTTTTIRTASGRTPQFDTTSFVHGKFQIGIGKGCLRSGWDGGHRDQGTRLSSFHRRRRRHTTTTTTTPRWRRIVLSSSSSWCCLGSSLHVGFWQKQR